MFSLATLKKIPYAPAVSISTPYGGRITGSGSFYLNGERIVRVRVTVKGSHSRVCPLWILSRKRRKSFSSPSGDSVESTER